MQQSFYHLLKIFLKFLNNIELSLLGHANGLQMPKSIDFLKCYTKHRTSKLSKVRTIV